MTANSQSNSEGSIDSYPYDQNAVCMMVELMLDIGLPHLSEARLRDQKHFVKTSTIRTQEGVAVDTYHFESGDIKGVVVYSKFDAFFITAQFGHKAIPESIRSRAHLLSLLSIADPPKRDETLSLECGNILVSLRLEAQQIESIKFTRVNYD